MKTGVAVVAMLANLVISIVACCAIGDLIVQSWGWPELLAYTVAAGVLFLTRGLAAPLAIWGAVSVWYWSFWEALLLFMWPVVLVVFFGAGAKVVDLLKPQVGKVVRSPEDYAYEAGQVARRKIAEVEAKWTVEGLTTDQKIEKLSGLLERSVSSFRDSGLAPIEAEAMQAVIKERLHSLQRLEAYKARP